MCVASRRGVDHRACPGPAHCLGFRSIGRALVKYMQRVLVFEQTLCGVSRLHATATTVRYTRCTGMLSLCMGQHSRFLVKSCLFWLLPSSQPMLIPNAIALSIEVIRTASMGRSDILQPLSFLNDRGASLFTRRIGILRYAELSERFQKGLCQCYSARWSRSLSFDVKLYTIRRSNRIPATQATGAASSFSTLNTTYLLGRRIANLRPAFREVLETGGIR